MAAHKNCTESDIVSLIMHKFALVNVKIQLPLESGGPNHRECQCLSVNFDPVTVVNSRVQL